MSGTGGTGGSELARALAGADVPGAYAAALEAGGCGLGVLEGVWRAAEAASVGDGEETGESKGEVRDVAWSRAPGRVRTGEAVRGRGAVGGTGDVPVAGGERGGGAVFGGSGLGRL
jgi:hypothetical protein